MKKYRWPVIIERDEDGYYVAIVPTLKGCHTQARSLDDLMERTREAISLCMEVQKREGQLATQPEIVGFQEIEVTA